MTRRTWRWIVGACLCTGFLPGCAISDLKFWGAPAVTGNGGKVANGSLPDREKSRDVDIRPAGGTDRVAIAEKLSPYAPTPDRQVFDPRHDRFLEVSMPDPKAPLPTPTLPPTSPSNPPSPPKEKLPEPTGATEDSEPPSLPQVEEPIVAALACFLKKDDPKAAEEALHHLEHYDGPTKEWFQRVLPVVAELTRKGVEKLSQDEIALMQEELQSLLLTLRARSTLAIDKMCYCEGIEGYGKYKTLPDAHPFLAACGGRPGELVLLYLELRNVGSVRRGAFYETRLASHVSIYDSRDRSKPVYTYNLKAQNRPLRSPNLCNDYFQGYSFYVPAMPPGKYTLRLEVTDESGPAPRSARHDKDFVVAATETACGNE